MVLEKTLESPLDPEILWIVAKTEKYYFITRVSTLSLFLDWPRPVCQTWRQLTASSGCPGPLTERAPALSPGRYGALTLDLNPGDPDSQVPAPSSYTFPAMTGGYGGG